MKSQHAIASGLVALAMGCGADIRPQVVSAVAAANGECASGGVVVQQGVDDDGDGKLDAEEVDSAQPVCNGTDGSCSVKDNGDGTKTITCADGTSVNISDGARGVDGAGNRVVTTYSCTGTFDVPFAVWYDLAILASGDMFASAYVEDGSAMFGKGRFLPSTALNVATAPVVFTWDVSGSANAGFWVVSLNRTSLVLSIEYWDFDVTGGKLTWSLAPSDCTRASW